MKIMPLKTIEEYLRPIAEETGVELVEAAWDNRTHALTLYIDAPQGVDLVLCEKFHRAVDGPLDELDPTFGAPYTLNCSSLGLDRPFKTQRDYEKHYGEKVEIHLFAPLFGAKYHEGTLLSSDETSVTVAAKDGTLVFPKDKIAKACLCIEI